MIRKMMALAAVAAATTVTVPALAHDFWIQPRTFFLPAPGAVPVTLQVGHAQFRQRWNVPAARIGFVKSFGPKHIQIDETGDVKPSDGISDGSLNFAVEGTYVVAMQTSFAQSELPAIRFNDYLKVEGLTPAIDYRRLSGTAGDPGRERYSRRAKSLIQVGSPAAGSQPQVTRQIGLALELVPERNPYELKPGDPLPMRVYWNRKPLAGALVKLTNLDFDAVPTETHLTDAAGRAMFTMPPRGSWQFNVIWTKVLTGDPAADFETTFSSLTFGSRPKPVAAQ